MAAFYLLMSVAGFSSMSLLVKLAQRHAVATRGLVCAMFLCAAAVVSVMLGLSPAAAALNRELVLLAFGAGLCSVLAFTCTSFAIEYGHFGLAVTFANASFLLSVLFAVFAWDQQLGALGALGLLLALGGLAAMTSAPQPPAGQSRPAVRGPWLALVWASFLLSGACQICQAAAARLPAEQYNATLFLLIQYTVGGTLLLPAVLKNREYSRPALLFGALAALSSIAGTFFILRSLSCLPESLVFPVCLCGPILISVGLSLAVFREPLRQRSRLGVLCGIAGLICLALVPR